MANSNLRRNRGGGAGGGGAGGGAELIYSATSDVRGPRLNGTHIIGATTLTLSATPAEMALFFVGQHIVVGLEEHRVTAVDAANFMITIESPGMVNNNVNGPVQAGVMIGENDTFILPNAGNYSELDIRFLYTLPAISAASENSGGKSTGAYYAGGDEHGSWYNAVTYFNRWWTGAVPYDASLTTYTVGLLPQENNVNNSWALEYNPTTGELSFAKLNAVATALLPKITNIIIAGA